MSRHRRWSGVPWERSELWRWWLWGLKDRARGRASEGGRADVVWRRTDVACGRADGDRRTNSRIGARVTRLTNTLAAAPSSRMRASQTTSDKRLLGTTSS